MTGLDRKQDDRDRYWRKIDSSLVEKNKLSFIFRIDKCKKKSQLKTIEDSEKYKILIHQLKYLQTKNIRRLSWKKFIVKRV